jgi:CheY-like chemotaxis protein
VEVELEKQHAPETHAGAPPAIPAGFRVLVVDDFDLNRRILCEQLRSWGCVADEAASGLEALDTLRAAAGHEPYRLVFLDMRMPDMDGEMTAHAIKADPRLATVALVLLSSMGSRGTLAEMREKGFFAALIKPVRRSHLLDIVSAVAADERHVPVRRTAHAPGTGVDLGLRILVAEDNPVNQRVALQILARLGCQATAVDTGAQAVAAIECGKFDVVFMDVQMPEMDGITATAVIREREAASGSHLPIVGVTAHAMEGDRERCIGAGMDGYVSKPLKTEDVIKALMPYGKRTAAVPAAGESAAPKSAA